MSFQSGIVFEILKYVFKLKLIVRPLADIFRNWKIFPSDSWASF